MYALSFIQPQASALALGIITSNTRTWKRDYRGIVAIHALLHTPAYALEAAWKAPWNRVLVELGVMPGDLPAGAIVGVAMLTAIEVSTGGYTWHFAEPLHLTEPVPCTGYGQLWPLDAVTARRVATQAQLVLKRLRSFAHA